MRSTISNPLRPVLKAYDYPEGPRRERALKRALATEKVKQEIRNWLQSHEEITKNNPIFSDLKRRLFKPIQVDREATRSFSWMETALKYCSGVCRSIGYRDPADVLVNAIQSQDWNKCKETISYHPLLLVEKAGYFKDCLANRMLPYVEFMTLLEIAAAILKEPIVPSFPDTWAAAPDEHPSLFRLFSKEICEQPVWDDIETISKSLKSLLQQDEASAAPFFSSFDVESVSSLLVRTILIDAFQPDRLLDYVTMPRPHSKDWPRNKKELDLILPILLKRLSISDLYEVLHTKIFSNSKIANWINKMTFAGLSKSECWRFCNAITKENITKQYLKMLPPYAITYLKSLSVCNRDGFGSFFCRLHLFENLTENEEDAVTAHFIEMKEIPFCVLDFYFSKSRILRLASHLRLLNFQSYLDADFARQIVLSCPNLYVIYIHNRDLLNKIAVLPNCQTFIGYIPQHVSRTGDQISGNFLNLPQLPQCKYLYLDHNKQLKTFPYAPQVRILSISSCEQLRELPPLNHCHKLILRELSNYPKIPLLAPGATVIVSEPLYSTIFFDDLFKSPKTVLLEIGTILRNYLPFPRMTYLSAEGDSSQAFDLGGVQRDALTRLCENLFKVNYNPENSYHFLRMDPDGKPIFLENNSNEIEAYQVLAIFFLLCYQNYFGFRTGPLFSEEVYSFICNPFEPGSDLWFLQNHLKPKFKRPEILKWMLFGNPLQSNLTSEELETFYYLSPETFERSEQQTEDHARQSFTSIRDYCLNSAKEDLTLQAVAIMASEIKKRINPITWNNIINQDPKDLQNAIEGVLTSEELKKMIVASSDDHPENGDFHETMYFLNNWIDRASKEELSRFLQAVTGSKRLSNRMINVSIFSRGQNNVPSTHTCTYTLELSSDYIDQQQFDKKMHLLITEGLAGISFSVI